MLSEWMLEVPDNFAEDWVMVPCPVGKRSLVVASNGTTKSYARSGYWLNSFPSYLPGGCRQQRHGYSRSDNSVLDCIYSEVDRTYYILDLMCWASYPIYDSETEFRFFWLQTKLHEMPDVFSTSKINPYRFELLPRISCSAEALSTFISSASQFELDGLLFYHKRTHYTFGPSPLVVWLKAYMLPEILDISVPADLLAQAPPTYAGFNAHAETVRLRKHERQQKPARDMDDGELPAGDVATELGQGQNHGMQVEQAQTEGGNGGNVDQEHQRHNMEEQQAHA